jgi:hypothetical protein
VIYPYKACPKINHHKSSIRLTYKNSQAPFRQELKIATHLQVSFNIWWISGNCVKVASPREELFLLSWLEHTGDKLCPANYTILKGWSLLRVILF